MNLLKNRNKRYLLVYSVLFLFCCLCCYFYFYTNDKSLINTSDGWIQHYKAYIYYGDYIRGILSNLWNNHRLVIPQWSFSIGEGADIIGILHYYVVGDPFAFFTVFVPREYTYIYYNFSIILRLYLSGLAFSYLCFYLENKNNYAIVSGSLVYTFCYWSILLSTKHIYFLNPMINMPLLIIGVEKILKENKPYFLVFSVLISSVSNFYFFYMMVILTIVYVVIRLFIKYHDNFKELLYKLFNIAKYAIIGVLIGSVIVMPIIYVFINDNRMGLSIGKHLLYPISYYLNLPSTLLSTSREFWLCMGYAVPVIFAAIVSVVKFKKDITLFVLDIVAVIFVIFPIFGQVLNGMSYLTNRWSFALGLLMPYNLVRQWDNLKENKLVISIIYMVFSLACIAFGSHLNVNIPIAIGFIFLGLLFINMNFKIKQILMVMLIFVNIVFLANWDYAPFGSNRVGSASTLKEDKEILTSSEAYLFLQKNKGEDFYRYTGNNLTQNASLLFDTNSTDYFWSLTNPYTSQYRTDLELNEYSLFNFKDYDSRTILNTLANVKYFIRDKKNNVIIPYGYSYYENLVDYEVYKNDYYLPFGYTYENVISYKDWENLNAVDKENAMLTNIVLDNVDSDYYETSSINVPFVCIESNGIRIEGNNIYVSEKDSFVTLKLNKLCEGEFYVGLNNVEFDDQKNWMKGKTTNTQITIETAGIVKSITFRTNDDKYYNGRKNFVSYLGSINTNEIKLIFSEKGRYKIDLSCLLLPLSDYNNKINKLKENVLKDVKFDTNSINAEISVDKDKYLLLSIPYSKGWKAYIDGKEAELLKSNIAYMSLYLEKGYHKIQLKYETPLLRFGYIVSGLGIIALFIDATINRKQIFIKTTRIS